VVGAGLMAGQLALLFARRLEVPVVLTDLDQDRLDKGVGYVHGEIATLLAKGRINQDKANRLTALVTGSLTKDAFADADFVIEAVFEELSIKKTVLAELEQHVSPEAILATNTSSLSITELAGALQRPARFLGMHFFNPVPASKLVEVVVAPETAPDVVASTRGWVRALGKTDVVVKDSPGFASSRLGVLLGLEAIRMLEEGVADADAIDAAMELGYRHPMGPLRSTDLVGLDVRLAIAEYLAGTLGERFTPPQLLRDKVAAGELGRKTGRGFFTWETT
jgi:3-hydroxybutyryl-CoA dehydrogenase